MRRGDVYFVKLDPIQGREQAGTRPVVVIASDDLLRRPLVVPVVPGTDGANVPDDHPHSVRVPAGTGRLTRETVFLCFQVRALDRSRFTKPPVGSIPPEWMEDIDAALRYSLDLPESSP